MTVKGPKVPVPLFIQLNLHYPALWIAAGIIFVILVLLYCLHAVREKKMLKQLLAEQELKALRAQLNPHLLQNTFEILASRIVHQHTDAAILFIRQVADYLRKVLYLSDKTIITLEEELEYTEQYLALQKNISNGLFDYSITVDDAVDTYGTDVPALLFQPVVENSIRHGFKNTAGQQGAITVAVQQHGQDIVCTLTDNGTGLQAQEAPGHLSRGLRLTLKRLELTSRTFKRSPYMEVRTNEQGGVTTIIKIPAG